MAITRAQQAKQMLQDGGMLVKPGFGGKRQGYRGEAAAASDAAAGRDAGRDTSAAGTGNVGDDFDRGSFRDAVIQGELRDLAKRQAEDKLEEQLEKFRDLGSKQRQFQNYFSKISPFAAFSKQFGPLNNRDFFVDKVLGSRNFADMTKEQFANLTNKQQENIFDSYMEGRMSGQTDAYGNEINQGGGGGINQIIPIDTTFAQAPSDMEQEPEESKGLRLRFAADGGRIGAQEGGIMPRLNQLGSGVSSAEQTLQDINQRLESAESSLGGGGVEQLQAVRPSGSGELGIFPSSRPENAMGPIAQIPASGGMKLPVFTGTPQSIDPAPFMRPGNIPGTDVPFSTLRSSLNQFSSGIDQLNVTPPQTPVAMQSPLQQAVGMADGGIMNNDIVGGMMDGNMDEMGRQMYGLGKLVKKVTRGVKKIVKSPLGKAAIAGYFLGGGSLGGILKSRPGFSFANLGSSLGLGTLSGGEENIFTGGKFSNLANIVRDKLTSTGGKFMAGATLASLLPFFGLGTGDESEEEAKKILDNSGISKEEFDRLRNDIDYQNSVLGRRSRAGGGIMRLGYQEGGDAEPVAKKTMPLLDMDGMEKDYRETGGFVEMGRMERADDVPARLSKNEFVFTADAVRNAGDGDIDKGAEVMYNMMKNLEDGGDVSEESQGLEGARKMFQTSQRLEEVL